MSKSVKEILELKQHLLSKYSNRNEVYRKLRSYYDAEYWKGTEVQGIKLIYNLLAAAVDRYTDFMIQPPDWRVLPAGTSMDLIKAADKQEKLLYTQYDLNEIPIVQSWMANLQALLGFYALEIRPNPDGKEKLIQLDVPVPEYVLPLPKSDNVWDIEACIILGDQYTSKSEQFQPDIKAGDRIVQANIVKYYDKNELVIIRDGKEEKRIVHEFGFLPVVFGQNRVKPHYIEGIGDLEQAAGLQKYFNDLMSWNADIIEYMANPIQIIKGYTGDKLPTGAGAQWHLGKDMDANFLLWPGSPPDIERMMVLVQRAIEDLTFLGDATFGRNIPSGTSGSAVKSLLSGIQAAFLRKQVTMGTLYRKANEVIFRIIEKYWYDKEFTVRGTKRGSTYITTMKGKEIAGNYRTQIIWPPGILDQPSRVDLELTKLNAKVQSRRTTMENINIISPTDELELIRGEIEEELAQQSFANNPGLALGIDKNKVGQYQNVSNELGRGAVDGADAGDTPTLIRFVASIQKIKGEVYLDTNSTKPTLVLTEMKDKSTILNKLPDRLKGKDKLDFRQFVDGQDEELQPIIEREDEAATV